MRPLLFAVLLLVLLGCGRERHHPDHVVRAMYHWRNTDFLYDKEQHFLRTHHVNVLFWKVLDIDWNEANEAHPVSIVRSPFIPNSWGYGGQSGPWVDSLSFVPVVYITNRTMLQCDSAQLVVLADKLQRKLLQLCGTKWNELQLDCDWSARSKDRYFTLVRMMRDRLKCRISATVRLHQFKDPKGTGVPPADRGMLMLYNVEDVRRSGPRNSIFNADAAEPYFRGAGLYPLPLDVSLPGYAWLVHYRKGRFVGLQDPDLMDGDSTLFRRGADGVYTVVKETESWWGDALHIGDELELERADSTVVQRAVEM
ncbi:MAG TPA: hypothetical protein VHL57_11460, partial [Flavobacteriales bacterium]|nr:hypothetical protein [Flavobacteriales bacterium]